MGLIQANMTWELLVSRIPPLTSDWSDVVVFCPFQSSLYVFPITQHPMAPCSISHVRFNTEQGRWVVRSSNWTDFCNSTWYPLGLLGVSFWSICWYGLHHRDYLEQNITLLIGDLHCKNLPEEYILWSFLSKLIILVGSITMVLGHAVYHICLIPVSWICIQGT